MDAILIRGKDNLIKDAWMIRCLGYTLVFGLFKDTKKDISVSGSKGETEVPASNEKTKTSTGNFLKSSEIESRLPGRSGVSKTSQNNQTDDEKGN